MESAARFQCRCFRNGSSLTRSNHAVKLHYQSTGSDLGISLLAEGKADFAATERPLTDDQLRTARQKLGADVLQVPVVLGAIVPIYRIDGADVELKFTPSALAGIFLGKITRWSDSAIADANPDVPLPDEKIIVVHRSDRSDTTYLWTEFLSKVSSEWKAGPGSGLSVKWPAGGIGVAGDGGVESLVTGHRGDVLIDNVIRGIPNSIGYVQLHFAIEEKLPYGDVQNPSGAFARATASSIMAEATSAAASTPDAYRRSLVNEPSPIGYPISSFTWIVVPANMRDKGKAKAMAEFLKWALKDGQEIAERMHYVRIPASIMDAAAAEAAKVQ
jgi:phosphate transport system substrate-binding protein